MKALVLAFLLTLSACAPAYAQTLPPTAPIPTPNPECVLSDRVHDVADEHNNTLVAALKGDILRKIEQITGDPNRYSSIEIYDYPGAMTNLVVFYLNNCVFAVKEFGKESVHTILEKAGVTEAEL